MDGLIAALASLASQPEQLDSPKTQRQLGDRVREALLKNLKELPPLQPASGRSSTWAARTRAGPSALCSAAA
jgi:hypothetical protein